MTETSLKSAINCICCGDGVQENVLGRSERNEKTSIKKKNKKRKKKERGKKEEKEKYCSSTKHVFPNIFLFLLFSGLQFTPTIDHGFLFRPSLHYHEFLFKNAILLLD